MPKTKNGARNCQNGGKVSVLQVDGHQNQIWVPTSNHNEISRLILENTQLLKSLSTSSSCSMLIVGTLIPKSTVKIRSRIYNEDGSRMIEEHRKDIPSFVNEGIETDKFCMKISLTSTHDHSIDRVEWDETATLKIRKTVTTVREATNEVYKQMEMYNRLLYGENASEIIPDAIAAYVITPQQFKSYVDIINTKTTTDPETSRVINWIIDSATRYNLNIHIAFMEFLEGFETLANFFRGANSEYNQRIISCKMAVVILTLLLKTSSASWDFHSNNGLIKIKDTKYKAAEGRAVDFGRIYSFDDLRTKELILHYLKTLWQDHTEHDEGLRHFFNIADISMFESLLTVFNKHYDRLLLEFPEQKHEYSSWAPNKKQQYIYESLIIIAFIDGITQKIKRTTDGFQCSSIMKRIFRIENKNVFDSLTNFLDYFNMDYDVFLRKYQEAGNDVDLFKKTLNTISTSLEPMLLSSRSTTQTTDIDGGKKRRHTQKKYKIRRYSYSRNKHRLGTRRVRKT
jgi:hypothetical protein